MSPTALLVADAAPSDGLGHLSRLSGIAVALRSLGIETRCYANGAAMPLERDGVAWAPWSPGTQPPADVDVVILDSYRFEQETAVTPAVPLVVFRDHSDIQTPSALVVSVAAPPSDEPPLLSGPQYAALRPAYWGLPSKDASGPLRQVLVTTGGGDPGGIGTAIAQALARRLPEVTVTFVRGPHAPPLANAMDDIRVLEAPDSLFDEQLGADLVISGAGQTMLESLACGTPCLALVLAENQREQAARLESSGAVVLVDPADVDATASVVESLDPTARRELSRRAQGEVDGYGAIRIAHHVEALLR